MDEVDERLFSLALEEEFERVVFVEGGGLVERPIIPSIADSKAHSVQILFPPPGWVPEVVWDSAVKGKFTLRDWPQLSVRFFRSSWWWGGAEPAKWAFSLPTLEHGIVSLNYCPDDPEEKDFQRRVWRVLNRLTTNRMKKWHPASGSVYSADTRGELYWAGHHALEWCRADQRRMLAGLFQPRDDWAPPDTAWHRRLRARLEASGVDATKAEPREPPPPGPDTFRF